MKKNKVSISCSRTRSSDGGGALTGAAVAFGFAALDDVVVVVLALDGGGAFSANSPPNAYRATFSTTTQY